MNPWSEWFWFEIHFWSIRVLIDSDRFGLETEFEFIRINLKPFYIKLDS